MMTRGKLAQKTDVNFETLRYYERKGLIPEPPRSKSGYRLYPDNAIVRIRFIKRAQVLGFSLVEIAELLSLRIDPDTTGADVKELTEAKIEDVRGKIRDLKKMEKALRDLSELCTGCGPTSECPILDAMGAPSK